MIGECVAKARMMEERKRREEQRTRKAKEGDETTRLRQAFQEKMKGMKLLVSAKPSKRK